MCLYPKLIKNRKYTANKKNGGVIPSVTDVRMTMIPVGCGNCIECRKQKARGWQLRLLEEVRDKKNGKFITLTFSNASVKELIEQKPTKNWPSMAGLEGYELDNEIATRAVRLWLERWRKKNGTSVRHWLITELGHNGTENIHLHGIVWTDKDWEEIRETWQYGYMWPRKEDKEAKQRNYVGEQTVNYIIKYITKVDKKHKEYKSKILTSAGIGNKYPETVRAKQHKFNGKETKEEYRTYSGHKMAMPIYWRNKIYTEKEREELWIKKLDEGKRYVCGEEIDANISEENYYKVLKHYRELNRELGYGNDEKNWNRIVYERERRKLLIETRIKKEGG